MRKQKVPMYRHHKGIGPAVVTIDGKSVYLGLHGSPDSHRRYAEEIENGIGGMKRRSLI
ncbi:hypothetical protein AB1L42_02310 [Thalassoglobus sp. JC818]|uniref:hypothetical protein n=1 Tax=Thalassoglobus sp. JC818 TaxID=3232136 RepID=UPI0034587160